MLANNISVFRNIVICLVRTNVYHSIKYATFCVNNLKEFVKFNVMQSHVL